MQSNQLILKFKQELKNLIKTQNALEALGVDYAHDWVAYAKEQFISIHDGALTKEQKDLIYML
jgi:hypothetical protein